MMRWFRWLFRAVVVMSAGAIALIAAGQMSVLANSPPTPIPASQQSAGHPVVDPNGFSQNVPGRSPSPNPANNVSYHNGPVMHSPVVYNVFWLPSGQHLESAATTASDTAYENLMNRYFNDVGGTNYFNLVTQYPDTSGPSANAVTFGGSYVDATAYPHAGTQADPLLDADIQAAVSRAQSSQHWAEDVNHEYFIYLGLNVAECMTTTSDCSFFKTGHVNAYCAYHFDFSDSNNSNATAIYAFMGDQAEGTGGCGIGAGGPNNRTPTNDLTADAQVGVVSHEFFESVTDAEPSTGWSGGGGGGEIGDKCNQNGGPQNQDGADLVLHGDGYIVQMEWSNAVSACAMDLCGSSDCPPSPTFQKSADATATTGQNYSINISVSNPSDTDAATSLVVTDILASGSTYASGSASPAPSSQVGQVLTWDFAALAVHQPISITFQAVAGQALQNNTTLQNCANLTFQDSLGNPQAANPNSCATTTAVNVPPTLVLPGDQSGDFNDSMSFVISATDPEASDTLSFSVVSGLPAGLSLQDNGNRTATVAGAPTVPAGTYVVVFSVSDAHNPPVTGSLNLIVTLEESSVRYTGPTVIANSKPVTLTALLLEDGNTAAPIQSRMITFTLGSGASLQTCSGTTLGNGTASCPITSVNQPLGPVAVSVQFAGDNFYLPSSRSATAILFAFLASGSFVIGDKEATVGNSVTFWGSTWTALNPLSSGSAPSSMKGFASATSEPPANGNTWSCTTGNSPPPPSGPLPSYMGVIVSDSISKTGSTVSGDTVHIVVVATNPGYQPDPAFPGTGTMVAVYT